jgi:hypothetical protein
VVADLGRDFGRARSSANQPPNDRLEQGIAGQLPGEGCAVTLKVKVSSIEFNDLRCSKSFPVNDPT